MKYLHYIILWAAIIFIMLFNFNSNDKSENKENDLKYTEINSNIKYRAKYNENDRFPVFEYVDNKEVVKSSIGYKSKLISDLRKLSSGGSGGGFGAITGNNNDNNVTSLSSLGLDSSNNYSNSNYDYSNDENDSNSFSLSDFNISTFAIDVDTVSYSYIKNKINKDIYKEQYKYFNKDNIRIEEMVNYFDYDYLLPENETFNIITEISKLSFENNKYVLHIGIKGKEEKLTEIPQVNLIFLIDTSGSMSEENKMSLVKKSLIELTKNLRNIDKITIITYDNDSTIFLDTINGDKKDVIINKINELDTKGSTNGEAGLKLAYKTAERTFVKNGINRIILCTDGEFNSGMITEEELKKMIVDNRKKEIALTTLAFSNGTFNDDLLKKLSSVGNGNYYYINDFNEAIKVLSNQLTSTLKIIAKDVKVQIEFNTQNIKNYKLMGYETKMLNTEDFNNDKVDSNELGSGHSVTALYEIELKERKPNNRYKIMNDFENELAVVNIRYKEPNETKSKEVNKIINKTDVIKDFFKTSDNFKFSLAVAYFGLLLNHKIDNYYLNLIIKLAKISKGKDKYGYKEEFIKLLEKYNSLVYPYFTSTKGELKKEEVINIANKKSEEFLKCYDKYKTPKDEYSISFNIKFYINKNGYVENNIVIDDDFVKYKNLNDCIIYQIKQLKFPQKENTTIVWFEMGFNKKTLNPEDKVEIYF